MVLEAYALFELSQMGALELVVEFLLTKKHYLDKLLICSLQVGKKPDFLKHLYGQSL